MLKTPRHLSLAAGAPGVSEAMVAVWTVPLGETFTSQEFTDVGVPGVAVVELEDVVVDVAGGVGGQRAGDEGVLVERRAERLDARHQRAVRSCSP